MRNTSTHAHTFFAPDTTWQGRGTYTLPSGERAPVVGRTTIRRFADRWSVDGEMTLSARRGEQTFTSRYVIADLDRRAPLATFESVNPALGRLAGRLVFFDDQILSSFSSEDGATHGVEVLSKVADDRYDTSGYLFAAGALQGRWELSLERHAAA